MNEKAPVDRLYAREHKVIERFRFDEQVARVFPDMIGRSVPGYDTVISMTGIIARQTAQPGKRIYDLGCSLGAAIWSARKQLDDSGFPIVGVDNSMAMLKQARRHEELSDESATQLVCADIRDVSIVDASLVIMNYTLQFIPREDRTALLTRIWQGLTPGGCLMLSEKICFDDPSQQARMTELHHAFKKANGYTDLEISQKRSALENVLVPDTLEEHRRQLFDAGFSSVQTVLQFLNFVSVLACK